MRRNSFLAAMMIGLFVILAIGCRVSPQGPQTSTACSDGEQSVINEFLYFGRAWPGGTVSDEQWSQFLTDTVTPVFPDGLTVWNAYGQYRVDDGPVSSEQTYILNVIHPADIAIDAAIGSIKREYISRYDQDSVLQVRYPACATF